MNHTLNFELFSRTQNFCSYCCCWLWIFNRLLTNIARVWNEVLWKFNKHQNIYSSPDLDSLFSESDEQLFDRINHIRQHILHQFTRFELQSLQPTPQQDHAWLLNWMTEILSLEIYTNTAINFHSCNICCRYIFNCILWDELVSLQVTCLELCKMLSWAAFISIE